MKTLKIAAMAIGLLAVAPGAYGAAANSAQQAETPAPEKPAPYDDKLERLAEILGSLDFIRNLCSPSPEPQWKAMMAKLLQEEASTEPARHARLTAVFNRGYRSFAAIQTSCNPNLRTIGDKYRIEGATLATEITARYGN